MTSAITTSTFFCFLSRSRSGVAIFPSDRMPVAHWYRSGANTWCWDRSIIVTATSLRFSARTANRPAKPPPTITTRR